MFIDPESPFRLINFEMGTEPHVYRDFLVLPRNRRFSKAEIETMKQEKYAEWLETLNPIPEPLPEVESPKLIGNLLDFVEIDGVRYYSVQDDNRLTNS